MLNTSPEDRMKTQEFVIYTYDKPDPDSQKKFHRSCWSLYGTKYNVREAVDTGQRLFGTGRYQKIEIKKKSFNARNNRANSEILKVIKSQKEPANISLLATIICAAGLSTAAIVGFIVI